MTLLNQEKVATAMIFSKIATKTQRKTNYTVKELRSIIFQAQKIFIN